MTVRTPMPNSERKRARVKKKSWPKSLWLSRSLMNPDVFLSPLPSFDRQPSKREIESFGWREYRLVPLKAKPTRKGRGR